MTSAQERVASIQTSRRRPAYCTHYTLPPAANVMSYRFALRMSSNRYLHDMECSDNHEVLLIPYHITNLKCYYPLSINSKLQQVSSSLNLNMKIL